MVRTRRGRARLERALGPADRIENVLEGLLEQRGAAPRVRAVRPAGAQPRGARRPARAADVHDRPGHREGLRRRDLRRVARATGSASGCTSPTSRGSCPPARRSTAAPPSARCLDYVPGFVAPMLPHELADDACSLRPNVDRLCVTVEILFDGACRRASRRFYRSVIRSNERLTYGQAESILAGRERAAETSPKGSSSPRRSRSSCGAAGSRAARCAIASAGDRVRVRRRGRGGEGVARVGAARARAGRGADDPRERGRRRAARRPEARGALPRARAARAAGGHATAREADVGRGPDACRRPTRTT